MQSEYSLIVRNPEIAVIEACKELGTSLVAFSPVGRGMFSQEPLDPSTYWEGDMRRSFFPRLAEPHFSKNMELVPMALDMAKRLGCSLPQFAIAWGLAKDECVVSIPGTKNLTHLEDNFGANDVVLSADDVAALDAHFAPEAIAGPRYSAMGQATVTTEIYPFEELEA